VLVYYSWLMKGAIIGMEGGSDEINRQLDHLQSVVPSMAISGIWMQDWCGNRQFPDRVGVWWNWQLDDVLYHDWSSLRQRTSQMDIRLLTYINPMLADISAKVPPSHDNLYLIAKAKAYLVRDSSGAIWSGYNGASLIDLTNPAAREWYKQLIKIMIIDVGSSGWMADFGESLPLDAVLFNGSIGVDLHNQWPALWQQLNGEAIAEARATNDVIYFSRSGSLNSPTVGSLMWLGDQLVTWDGYDGLRTVVTSLLSSSVSGLTLTHSDIGGYTMLNITTSTQQYVYSRSKELFWRWCEFAAFTTVYRSHPGSNPSSSWQYDTDRDTLEHFARFAGVYASWSNYRTLLMNEATSLGYPLARPLFLHYPSDDVVWSISNQFMVGSQFLVAPVLDADIVATKVYLPR
jgi:alpha-glucosidase